MSAMVTENILTYFTAIISVVTVLVGILSAIRSGELKRFEFGSLKLEASEKDRKQARMIVHSLVHPEEKKLPFEIEQLAGYYAQVLAQSKISFWFSLIFASVGFMIIVIAGFRFLASDLSSAAVQIVSGTIIDAVAALFFVQANKAQSSMAAFFEKLRLDRQQMDARALCESITDEPTKNAMKVQLALYLSGIPKFDEISKGIVDACLSRRAP